MPDTIREVIHPTRVRLEGKVLSADVGGVDIASAREEHGLDENKLSDKSGVFRASPGLLR